MRLKNPYLGYAAKNFWKTGVAEVFKEENFDQLWQSKFPILKSSKIITVGSCFAQHISRWLKMQGYHWIESELYPSGLSENEATDMGYGVFSFRTGNIYTPALLKQWLALALKEIPPIDEIFEEEGRFFDPLRPHLPPQGYESAELLFADREVTLSSIRQALSHADIFIFTLGLTEAWRNVSGYIYPACPGTIRGQFNTDEHYFINYDYKSIYEDLEWIVAKLKSINPSLRFLLTVSPVPLTATATQSHVLTATTYSKSVLRCAAGYLAATHSDVDYFPSYELIISGATRRNFFEDNLRSVRSEGVEFVMSHFAAGLSQSNARSGSDKTVSSIEDVICEEILLETWNQATSPANFESTFCLFGDSHMGKLSQALELIKEPHFGGMIMSGSAWTSNLLHIDSDELFVPLENPGARERWQRTLPFFSLPSAGRWVVTNVGMQTHRSVQSFIDHLYKQRIQNLSDHLFASYFYEQNSLKIELVKNLRSRGYRVLVLSDPPTRNIYPPVAEIIDYWVYYDRQSLKIFHDLGCDTFNAGLFFSNDNFKDVYYSSIVDTDGTRDWYHGSDMYYADLAKTIADVFLKLS